MQDLDVNIAGQALNMSTGKTKVVDRYSCAIVI